MSKKSIERIIQSSTIRPDPYKLIKESDTRWKLKGSISSLAIEYLHKANYTCYLRDGEFLISNIMVGNPMTEAEKYRSKIQRIKAIEEMD